MKKLSFIVVALLMVTMIACKQNMGKQVATDKKVVDTTIAPQTETAKVPDPPASIYEGVDTAAVFAQYPTLRNFNGGPGDTIPIRRKVRICEARLFVTKTMHEPETLADQYAKCLSEPKNNFNCTFIAKRLKFEKGSGKLISDDKELMQLSLMTVSSFNLRFIVDLGTKNPSLIEARKKSLLAALKKLRAELPMLDFDKTVAEAKEDDKLSLHLYNINQQ